LIEFARAFKASGTGEAASLMAKRGEDNTLGESGVPDVLVRTDEDGALARWCEEMDLERGYL
jgi:hypothetical protein